MGEWLNKSFGSYKAFREAFIDIARSRFASGWTWLVPIEGTLDVISTANAETPIVKGIQPSTGPGCLGARLLPGL
jgi:Fe-Mn family superoxide dismutase